MDLKRIIIIIFRNFNFFEVEKFILYKGLNFIFIKLVINEFIIKDCEKFFRWL